MTHGPDPRAPDLTVIVVSHGHEAELPACLTSLARALEGLRTEIVVVDNLGAGAVAAALEACPAARGARLLVNDAPRGFAANVNRAAAAAAGRHLLILNPDTEHCDGRLADALAFLRAHPAVGVLGCALLNPDGTRQQSFRSFPSPVFLLARGLGADRWPWRPAFYRRLLMEGVPSEGPHAADWVFGAFMLLRRAEFHAVGGMDEGFRLYYEDVDLCRRLRAAGLATMVYPGLRLTHAHGRVSAKRPFGRTWRWHVASAARYFWKAARAGPLASPEGPSALDPARGP